MNEYMTMEDAMDDMLNQQMIDDVMLGTINPLPVLEVIKYWGIWEDQDLDLPAYAREAAKRIR